MCNNAFCYARIEGDVYMQPTPHYQLPPGHCFKLERSLHTEFSTLVRKFADNYIKSLHFCLYHTTYKGEHMYLMIYVDDIIIDA